MAIRMQTPLYELRRNGRTLAFGRYEDMDERRIDELAEDHYAEVELVYAGSTEFNRAVSAELADMQKGGW